MELLDCVDYWLAFITAKLNDVKVGEPNGVDPTEIAAEESNGQRGCIVVSELVIGVQLVKDSGKRTVRVQLGPKRIIPIVSDCGGEKEVYAPAKPILSNNVAVVVYY